MDEGLKGVDRILRYLDEHGIERKDVKGEKKNPGNKRKVKPRRTSVSYIEQTLDLHGKTQNQARLLISDTVSRARQSGRSIKLIIVHGVGYNSDPATGPVLKQLVRQMVTGTLRNEIRDWRQALPKEGGDGATVVNI